MKQKQKKQKRANLSMKKLYLIGANFTNYDKKIGQVILLFLQYINDHKNDNF